MQRRSPAGLCLLLLLAAAEHRRSFVQSAPAPPQPQPPQPPQPHTPAPQPDGAPAGAQSSPKEPDEVRQLEQLKNSLGKTFSLLKTHSAMYSDVNGHRHGLFETQEEVSRDGQPVARLRQSGSGEQQPGATPATRVRTELELPAQGGPERPPDRRSAPEAGNSVSRYLPYPGAQYSPLDMAEYVFWTGDERGVTLAMEEFLQEGLMSREEAINFLQEIKYNLDFLQTHYAQQRLHSQEQQAQAKERAALVQKALRERGAGPAAPKRSLDTAPADKESGGAANQLQQQQQLGLSDEEYEELLERLRVADFLYTEYSLEEVIYQLAKVMFAQSLARGNSDAQEALQKFTSFLEAEAELGHISRSLEKKVLDVLIASLADTLTEQPQLLSTARGALDTDSNTGAGGGKLLHQLLLLNPAAARSADGPAGSTPGSGAQNQAPAHSAGKTKSQEIHLLPAQYSPGKRTQKGIFSKGLKKGVSLK